ncbi:helix-turn-helix transcriptional regulator [Pseudophaeobacter sp. A-200-2]|uniref:helix-turn-helix transcriptional regulator n=1 Tax=Pseudophaeobacter sp. A-200-2 TaxID=3098145 RepID=UPI0034D53BDE
MSIDTTTADRTDNARRTRKSGPQQHYFSAVDVARITGLHHSTIRRKVRQGGFPRPRIVLGQKRWHISDLQAAGIEYIEPTAA